MLVFKMTIYALVKQPEILLKVTFPLVLHALYDLLH